MVGLRTVVLVAATLLAEGDASAAGNAGAAVDWLGPAGAAIFGAGTVWAGFQRRLEAIETRLKDCDGLAAKFDALGKTVAPLKDDLERLRRRSRSLSQEVESMRGALRMMLIALKSDGAPRDELLADVSSTFAIPTTRAHDISV